MTTHTVVIEADVERLRGEFLAMPGMRLTLPQAARLLGVRVEDSAAALSILEDEGFLFHTAGGVYRRASPLLA